MKITIDIETIGETEENAQIIEVTKAMAEVALFLICFYIGTKYNFVHENKEDGYKLKIHGIKGLEVKGD